MTTKVVDQVRRLPVGSFSEHPLRLYALVLLIPVAYSIAIVVAPEWRLTWFSRDARVIVATSAVWLAVLAALTLRLPHRDADDPSRRAFVAALLAIGAGHALMLVGFILIPDTASQERTQVAGAYAWLAARYLAGLFFIAVALRRPGLSVRRWLAVIAGTILAAFVLCQIAAPWLPRPLLLTDDGLVVVNNSGSATIAISVVPTVLSAVGAVFAWRLFRSRGEPVYWWLSLALSTEALSKLHEILYGALFGPILTTADVLLVGMLLLLLAAALHSVRALTRGRAEALKAQSRDLRTQSQMLAAMARFTEREELFRSIVIHELGTPLAAIRAYAHVLSNPQTTREQRSVAAGGITAEAGRLTELAERLDGLRSLEDGDISVALRPVRLSPLLEEVARFGRALTGQHDVALVCDSVSVLADPVRLGQALRNLVSNAVRYAPQDTTILIRCRDPQSGSVAVEVIDQGPGIPPGERQRLLGRYQRATSEIDVAGMGLGLYIARCIAEAHGGSLYLDTADSGGTRAVMELKEAT